MSSSFSTPPWRTATMSAATASRWAIFPVGAATWRYLNLPIERPELLHIADWIDRLEKRPAFEKNVMLPLS